MATTKKNVVKSSVIKSAISEMVREIPRIAKGVASIYGDIDTKASHKDAKAACKVIWKELGIHRSDILSKDAIAGYLTPVITTTASGKEVVKIGVDFSFVKDSEGKVQICKPAEDEGRILYYVATAREDMVAKKLAEYLCDLANCAAKGITLMDLQAKRHADKLKREAAKLAKA